MIPQSDNDDYAQAWLDSEQTPSGRPTAAKAADQPDSDPYRLAWEEGEKVADASNTMSGPEARMRLHLNDFEQGDPVERARQQQEAERLRQQQQNAQPADSQVGATKITDKQRAQILDFLSKPPHNLKGKALEDKANETLRSQGLLH